MKILHQLGHQSKWALDAYFENMVGDGFIISAINHEKSKIGATLSGYAADKYLSVSFLDLQYYGGKDSLGKKLQSYEFHPINIVDGTTEVSKIDSIISGVRFQENIGFSNIIIPSQCIENVNFGDALKTLAEVNKELIKSRVEGKKYYYTIAIKENLINDSKNTEALLQALTDMKIAFDGYYIVCESKLESKNKISLEYNYYMNLGKIFSTLKKQGFDLIYGLSNIDALIFAALTDIDYISIGTYENLRKFNLARFTNDISGGKSDGWYYSEKILNFIRARQVDMLRAKNVLPLVSNTDNIFSETILEEGYPWNVHRPDVHKNYLVAISRQLYILDKLDPSERRKLLVRQLENAKIIYAKLEEATAYLEEESKGYHINTWLSLLKNP